MSLFRYLLDSNWLQRSDINDLEARAAQLESRVVTTKQKSVNLEQDVSALRRDVSGMLLMLETMQRVLADRGICSREDFVQRMRALDAEDGIVDGKMSPPRNGAADLRYCNACQHFNPATLRNCQYCGRIFGPKAT